MAQKKRKRKTKRKPQHEPYPAWMWMLFGLGIGLSVAFAIYMKYQQPVAPPQRVSQQPASMSAPLQAEPEPVAAAPESTGEENGEAKEPRFSFYSMLPSFEVIIPEEEADVSRDVEIEAVQQPGTYVLQAGSFRESSDADRRRAQIALLGIESRVQRIMIDDRTYHRVRVGPMNNLDELNRVRAQLRNADIDVLRIRLGD